MNEQVIQQEQALKALISINRYGVKSLLRKYNYKISAIASSEDLYAFLIVAISKNELMRWLAKKVEEKAMLKA
jgi:hypothetical protein